MMDGNRWIEIDISYMEILWCRIAYIEICIIGWIGEKLRKIDMIYIDIAYIEIALLIWKSE